MWTAPSSQGVLQCFDQIACVHMSGLWVRSHMNAGQDGFRDTGSKQQSDRIEGHWVYRSVPYHGSIDRTICSSSCKFRHRLSTVAVQVLPVSGQSLCSGDRGCRGVGFSCPHQLPGNTCHLVGQRHRGQLRRLALEQRSQPGQGFAAALILLNHGGCSDHQHALSLTGARTSARSARSRSPTVTLDNQHGIYRDHL